MLRLSCLLMLVLMLAATAAEITWTLPAGAHVQSTGTPMDSQFYLEVGAFSADFTPTSNNLAQWASHWTPFSRQRYETDAPTLAKGPTIDETDFAEGAAAFVWGFNVDQPTREWVLLADPNWTWPSPSSGDVSWNVSASSVALFGNIALSNQVLTTAPAGLAPDPVITAEEWRAMRFVAPALLNNPLISGWNADPDRDGLENLVEMALDTHPLITNPDQDGLPSGRVLEEGDDRLAELQFNKVPKLLLHYEVLEAPSSAPIPIVAESLRTIIGQAETPLANRQPQQFVLRLTIP